MSECICNAGQKGFVCANCQAFLLSTSASASSQRHPASPAPSEFRKVNEHLSDSALAFKHACPPKPEQAPRMWTICAGSVYSYGDEPSGYLEAAKTHVIEQSAYAALERERDELAKRFPDLLEKTALAQLHVNEELLNVKEERDRLAEKVRELEAERDDDARIIAETKKRSSDRALEIERLKKEPNAWREQAEKLAGALEQIRDAPGLGGLDFSSTKKWREISMAVMDKVSREALAAFEAFKKGEGSDGTNY